MAGEALPVGGLLDLMQHQRLLTERNTHDLMRHFLLFQNDGDHAFG
jgi:hypothetical protein